MVWWGGHNSMRSQRVAALGRLRIEWASNITTLIITGSRISVWV